MSLLTIRNSNLVNTNEKNSIENTVIIKVTISIFINETAVIGNFFLLTIDYFFFEICVINNPTFNHKKVALHVVKKLPVDFKGQISKKNITYEDKNLKK